jgi:hypothetical protein
MTTLAVPALATVATPLHRVECACTWVGYRRNPYSRPCPSCQAPAAALRPVWLAGCAPRRGRCAYLAHIRPPYKHAEHYGGKAASSGLLKAVWQVSGGEFAELAWGRPGWGRRALQARLQPRVTASQ